jgi:hypothetical protein
MWIKRQRYKRSIREPIEAAQLGVLIVGDGTRDLLWRRRVSWSSPQTYWFYAAGEGAGRKRNLLRQPRLSD